MTAHIEAKKGEIAPLIIMPGDPLRAKFIAEHFLTNAVRVNDIRLNLAYTGFYKEKRVTVFSSGMGMPSIAIYATELFKEYNVKKIIRLGSCGSYYEEIKPRDIILVEKAFTISNFAYQFKGTYDHLIPASISLNKKIAEVAAARNINLKIGNINTEDTFYSNVRNSEAKDNYCLAAEMECFALFIIANYYNKDASAILTVSNNLVTNEELSADEREKTFTEAMILALESI